MGTEPQNPLPNDANNDEEFASSFADFFQRLKNIYEMFVAIEAYNSESNGTLKQCQFAPMTESEVKAIVMTMKSESCEIDPIFTHIFKQLLPSIPPTVTKIVNLSLGEGEFCNKWKVVFV